MRKQTEIITSRKIKQNKRAQAKHIIFYCFRIPVGSSMFDKTPAPDPKFNNDIYYCNCNQAKKQVDCRIDNKASRPALHVSYFYFLIRDFFLIR